MRQLHLTSPCNANILRARMVLQRSSEDGLGLESMAPALDRQGAITVYEGTRQEEGPQGQPDITRQARSTKSEEGQGQRSSRRDITTTMVLLVV
ncbi:hypothetical protein Tco_0684479, partial [Tanacetum coccineum]